MPRSDLLISLVQAGAKGDQKLLRHTVEALAAEERAKQHHQLASRLEETLDPRAGATPVATAVPRTYDGGHGGLLFEVDPQRGLDKLVLPEAVVTLVRELVEEQHRGDLLRSHGLEPRSRVLLAGPPGNGKTSLAEALAHALMVPMFVVRYEAVVGSFLGETSSRLRRLFDFVRTQPCVLFFDEFDTLGKERGDLNETGEIKRVVSSLLLQIDALPSQAVVVTATNHPELLDRAVWRRFQVRLALPAPTRPQVEQWFRAFERRIRRSMGRSPRALAQRLHVQSFSELNDFCEDVQRRTLLASPKTSLSSIVASRLAQWNARFKPARVKRTRWHAD